MTRRDPRSRRQVLALLLSTALASSLRHAEAGPLDQGIGGTGAAPPTDESDRGIGGTGVIGTIRKFGSIVVNDMRIAYPPNAEVRIDGVPATLSDLKIGQVVRVNAGGQTGALSTNTIDVASEVVGQVERVDGKRITVLGQTVATGGLKNRAFAPGETVAVSGLRRNDGTVVASLIERRPGAPSRVAGPVIRADDGTFKIGNLELKGVNSTLIGRRAIVEGNSLGARYEVVRATSEATLLPGVRRLSVESYVERRGDRLALGSGFAVEGTGRLDLPSGRSVRAVLTTTVSADGRLQIEGVQANGRTYGGGGSGSGGSGERPGGPRGGNSGASGNGTRAPGGSSTPPPVGHVPPNAGSRGSPADSGFGAGPGGKAPGGFGGGGGGGGRGRR